jgi:hypothetical protein
MRLILSLMLGASLAAGQAITSPVITRQMQEGRQIIDDAIEALGGDNFLAITTKVEKGRFYSFYNRELSGLSRATVYTKFLVAPDPPAPEELYLRERQAFGEDEKWSVIFSETDGWEVTFRGARPLSEETLKAHRTRRRRDIFYILLRRLNEKGITFEHRGREIIDNKPLEVVEIIDAENTAVTVYFHYTSKLPIRQVFAWRDDERIRHEEGTIFDKYKDAGFGVVLPRVAQRTRDGVKTFSMFADTVEVNVPLDDNTIGLPGDIKMLEREQ